MPQDLREGNPRVIGWVYQLMMEIGDEGGAISFLGYLHVQHGLHLLDRYSLEHALVVQPPITSQTEQIQEGQLTSA